MGKKVIGDIIKGGLQIVREGLTNPQSREIQQTVKLLNRGEEPTQGALRSLANYLRNEGANVQYKDIAPGAELLPRGLPLKPLSPTDKFHRGSAASSPAGTPPIFTFKDNPQAALDYAQVFSPKTPGIIDEFVLGKSVSPASNRELYKILADEPGLLQAIRKEYARSGEELSSAHDYLYTDAFRKALKDWGYNSVHQLEDMPSTGSMAEGLIALDPNILKQVNRQYIGSPDFLKDYSAMGLTTEPLSADRLLLKGIK